MKLRRDMVSLNRALWLLAALLVLVSATLAGFWGLEGMIGSPKPLELPPLDRAAAPVFAQPKLPERNPFDLTGAAWRSPLAASKRVPGLEDMHGILASRTLSGVFTPTGLVKTGEPFAGGTLEAVTNEGVVLRMTDGTTKTLQRAEKEDKVREQLLELWAGAKRR